MGCLDRREGGNSCSGAEGDLSLHIKVINLWSAVASNQGSSDGGSVAFHEVLWSFGMRGGC